MADDNAPPAGDPWYKGADATIVGEIERRGLQASSPIDAFANVLKSHQEAEKFVGAPANEIVRWPKDSNDPNWAGVRARLDVPTEAREYDFSSLKGNDGTPLVSERMADALRGVLHGSNVGKAGAVEIAKAVLQYRADENATAASEAQARQAAEMAALKTAWGQNFDYKRQQALNVAASMFEKSGLKREDAATAINKLEGEVGGARVLEMFSSFASLAREDSFNPGGPGGGGDPNSVMSYQEAVATKAALMRDTAFGAKWLAGDLDAINKLDALDRIIVSSAPQDEEALFRAQLAMQTGRR